MLVETQRGGDRRIRIDRATRQLYMPYTQPRSNHARLVFSLQK